VLWDLAFEAVSEADLQGLITDQVREGLRLEYKQELPGGGPKDRIEFLTDVTAFANTVGGDILYGVREARDEKGNQTGLPAELSGLPGINAENEERRLTDRLQHGVSPRLPGVRIRAIRIQAGGVVMLMRIPRSWAAPHCVDVDDLIRVYRRTSVGKSPLDFEELKRAVLGAESIADRVRHLRRDRILLLESGESPAPLKANPTIVIHFIPFGAFDGSSALDLPTLDREVGLSVAFEGYAGARRFTADGFLASDLPLGRGSGDAYTLVFRTGVIEYAYAIPVSDERMYLPMVDVHRLVLDASERAFDLFGRFGVAPPIAVLMSLVHAKGARIPSGFEIRQDSPIDRDTVLAPEVVTEELDVHIPTLVRPLLDVIWNAAGLPQSKVFDFEKKPPT